MRFVRKIILTKKIVDSSIHDNETRGDIRVMVKCSPNKIVSTIAMNENVVIVPPGIASVHKSKQIQNTGSQFNFVSFSSITQQQ